MDSPFCRPFHSINLFYARVVSLRRASFVLRSRPVTPEVNFADTYSQIWRTLIPTHNLSTKAAVILGTGTRPRSQSIQTVILVPATHTRNRNSVSCRQC